MFPTIYWKERSLWRSSDLSNPVKYNELCVQYIELISLHIAYTSNILDGTSAFFFFTYINITKAVFLNLDLTYRRVLNFCDLSFSDFRSYLFLETCSLLCFSFCLLAFLIMENAERIVLLNSMVNLTSSYMVLHFLKRVKFACARRDAASSDFLKICCRARMPYIHFYREIDLFD